MINRVRDQEECGSLRMHRKLAPAIRVARHRVGVILVVCPSIVSLFGKGCSALVVVIAAVVLAIDGSCSYCLGCSNAFYTSRLTVWNFSRISDDDDDDIKDINDSRKVRRRAMLEEEHTSGAQRMTKESRDPPEAGHPSQQTASDSSGAATLRYPLSSMCL